MYARDHAAANPDQPVLIMANSGEELTYREYEERANRVAHFFRDVGLQPLDHIATFTENNIHLLEVEAAAERTGLYFTCINSYLSPEEAAYIVNDSTSRVFVTSKAKRDVALQLPALCPVDPCFRRGLQQLQESLGILNRTCAVEDNRTVVAATDRHGSNSLISRTRRTWPLPRRVVPA